MRNPEEGRATKNDVLPHLQIECSKMVHGVLVSISYNFTADTLGLLGMDHLSFKILHLLAPKSSLDRQNGAGSQQHLGFRLPESGGRPRKRSDKRLFHHNTDRN
jgi:hypothetical protein